MLETPISEARPNIEPDLAGSLPHGPKEDVSLLDILMILADRKRIIIWITAAFTLVSIPVVLLLPVKYTATVTVLPPEQNSSLGAMLASQIGSMGGGAGLSSLGGVAALAGGGLLKNPNDRYVGMLHSQTVEDAVIRQFGLEKEYRQKYLSDTRKVFEKYADVDGNAKDGLIHISVEDHDPRRAAEIANGYVEQFRKLSENLAITEASQRRLFLDRQLEQAKDNLANAEEAMKRMEQSTGLIELDTQARALIETVASLRAQITAQEMIIQGMQTYATDQNAQLIQAQKQLDSLRAELTRLGGSEQSKDALIVPKGLVPQAGLEYARRLRDVKYYETIFEVLARQDELAKLDEAREGATIQVLDPAIPPDKRSFPHRSLIVVCAFAAGFFLSILVAFAAEGFKRLDSDPETSLKLNHILHALKSSHS